MNIWINQIKWFFLKKPIIFPFQKKSLEEEGECEDGVIVKATHQYQVAEFNKSVADQLRTAWKEMKETLFKEYALESYKAEICRLQIQQKVYEIIHGVDDNKLCLGISVLFAFKRKLIKDDVFQEHVGLW